MFFLRIVLLNVCQTLSFITSRNFQAKQLYKTMPAVKISLFCLHSNPDKASWAMPAYFSCKRHQQKTSTGQTFFGQPKSPKNTQLPKFPIRIFHNLRHFESSVSGSECTFPRPQDNRQPRATFSKSTFQLAFPLQHPHQSHFSALRQKCRDL